MIPVALTIAGSDPMKTSVTSFVYGMAAFIVPFMFFYSPALLAQGDWTQILHYGATACIGVYLLAGALQAWYFGPAGMLLRVILFCASLLLIYGGIITDLAGLITAMLLAIWQYSRRKAR